MVHMGPVFSYRKYRFSEVAKLIMKSDQYIDVQSTNMITEVQKLFPSNEGTFHTPTKVYQLYTQN